MPVNRIDIQIVEGSHWIRQDNDIELQSSNIKYPPNNRYNQRNNRRNLQNNIKRCLYFSGTF